MRSICSALISVLFVLSASATFAGPSTYTENAKTQTGSMVVQFNYPDVSMMSAKMITAAPGPGYDLSVGDVLTVTSTKLVKASNVLPGSYDTGTKTLFVPALIVKKASGWLYVDVTLVATSATLDANNFPVEMQVTNMVATKVGNSAVSMPASSLDCVNTSVSSFTINANATSFFNNPACPAGYKAVTPYCWTAASGVYSQGSGYNANSSGNDTFCSWQNTTASNQTTFGGNVCCRVPAVP